MHGRWFVGSDLTFDFSSSKQEHMVLIFDCFICFGSTAFEPKMRLAFIFIETLTHRIITKKHIQIKTRQDIQEEIRKQSSPNEWVFLFVFLNST